MRLYLRWTLTLHLKSRTAKGFEKPPRFEVGDKTYSRLIFTNLQVEFCTPQKTMMLEVAREKSGSLTRSKIAGARTLPDYS